MAITKIGVLVTAIQVGIDHMTEGIGHITGEIDTAHHHQGHLQIVLGTGIKLPFMSLTNVVVDGVRQGPRLIVEEVHLGKGPAYQGRILPKDTYERDRTKYRSFENPDFRTPKPYNRATKTTEHNAQKLNLSGLDAQATGL